MHDRAALIQWIRGELVGPSQPLVQPTLVGFKEREFIDSIALRSGPLAWRPPIQASAQEVLYFDGESPHRKYGAGLLHPATVAPDDPAEAAAAVTDRGFDPDSIDSEEDSGELADDLDANTAEAIGGDVESTEDFQVSSADVRFPSTLGISFYVRLSAVGRVIVRLPVERRFAWQESGDAAFGLNGRYERGVRRWTNQAGNPRTTPLWRRLPVAGPDSFVAFDSAELVPGRPVGKEVPLLPGTAIRLRVEVFARSLHSDPGASLLTVVLRNVTPLDTLTEPQKREVVLYQTLFDVSVEHGAFERYPESGRPFNQLDGDEQSLALLYLGSATWAIGHGCAAGWDVDIGGRPDRLYADVMPAVEIPSMTPDIELEGKAVQLSMRSLANLSDDGTGEGWSSLERLKQGFRDWIALRKLELKELSPALSTVGDRHLQQCNACLERIEAGTRKLRENVKARQAFRLANLAMLLQQIATKQLERRQLEWDPSQRRIRPTGTHTSAWQMYERHEEDASRLGTWRAFQAAFLVMSVEGASDASSGDREIVDLIWFPTGGGKTEAYLGAMAFYMFHQRLLIETSADEPRRDGTNVIMRYTLRMLTTQQFQRAASLICAMEYLRRSPACASGIELAGRRFSLGLWIGGDGSPNKISEARQEIRRYLGEKNNGNPMVLTECPWCRSMIGRFDGARPASVSGATWNHMRLRGVQDDPVSGPMLFCPDAQCPFGGEQPDSWLPVEVIDERIYNDPPSLVIATVDKFAMMAYRPKAGAIFGRRISRGEIIQESVPPGLIVQDELHLISGPLGTMYALYEGIFERLCTYLCNGVSVRPKIIASTATIRGAEQQVLALYGRFRTQLFPSPGLSMGDSFFGRYARDANGGLRSGRLYLGIHATNYGSVLTTQVRTFSATLFRPSIMEAERRDPWWTLLAFYNSIRELGGAKTLFDSDIRSRLKFVFNREGYSRDHRRTLRVVEELTSRLAQSEIVQLMDQLSVPYKEARTDVIDACLASNIIEVGVDIDRLSVMGVVGQPKTTATYIQVTGRVGRRWWDRPGLVITIYSPAKSRDRSHFEQFHSYHSRLYERVEPTTATPFALSAVQRGLPGALLTWARQNCTANVGNDAAYETWVRAGGDLLIDRSTLVQKSEDRARSQAEIQRMIEVMLRKWQSNPQEWEHFPQDPDGEYLMLWPGQYATRRQRLRGLPVPSSMRQVDANAELSITQGYDVETPITVVRLPDSSGGLRNGQQAD